MCEKFHKNCEDIILENFQKQILGGDGKHKTLFISSKILTIVPQLIGIFSNRTIKLITVIKLKCDFFTKNQSIIINHQTELYIKTF